MACAMLSYNNVNQAAWECLVKAVADYGVTITTDTGQATAHGFTISWNFDRQSQILHIQCIQSPFFVPCSAINSHINDAIEKCLGQHNIALAAMIPA